MYKMLIEEQVQLLISKGLLPKEKEKEACELLKKEYWTNRMAITWGTEDIIERARESDVALDEDGAQGILYELLDEHDCNYGVTWDTIDNAINNFVDSEVMGLKNANLKDLPLLIGTFKSEGAKKMLERRIKGIKNWEDEPKE